MSLRNVNPSIPEGGQECAQLEEDLKKMRCAGLLERPWSLKYKDLVQKLIAMERPNMFDMTIQDWLQQWTSELWREMYNFPSGRTGLANWMDTYVDGKFTHQVDPKDN